MIAVNKENFEAEVLQSKMPVVVDIWGPQCAPCLALLPQVETLSGSFDQKVKFCKLNAAENRRLCITLKVMGLPSFLFYKKGEVVSRISGEEATADRIQTEAENLLK